MTRRRRPRSSYHRELAGVYEEIEVYDKALAELGMRKLSAMESGLMESWARLDEESEALAKKRWAAQEIARELEKEMMSR